MKDRRKPAAGPVVRRLRNPLPEWAAERLGDDAERFLYSMPYDLSPSGARCEGWLVVFDDRFACLEREGGVRLLRNVTEFDEYAVESAVGNAFLVARRFLPGRVGAFRIGEDADAGLSEGIADAAQYAEELPVARFGMSSAPMAAVFAKVLDRVREGVVVPDEELAGLPYCPTCGRRLRSRSGFCPDCTDRSRVVGRMWRILYPYRWSTLAGLVLAVATYVGGVLIQLLQRTMIDRYIAPAGGAVPSPTAATLTALLAVVAGLAAGRLALVLMDIARGLVFSFSAIRMSRTIRSELFSRIEHLSLSNLGNWQPGDLMTRVNKDTGRLSQFYNQQLNHLLSVVVTFVAACAVMFSMNWRMGLLVLAPVPFTLLAGRAFWRFMRSQFRRQWRVFDKANSLLQDILSGIRVVKAFGQEDKEVGRFSKASRDFADLAARNERMWNTLFPVLGFLVGLGGYLTTWYGGTSILAGTMTLGDYFLYSSYAGMIYGPLNFLMQFPRHFAEVLTSAGRIYEVLEEVPDVAEARDSRDRTIEGRVELRDVSFGYRSYEPVLRHIDLTVEAGEMIGIVGLSGMGKSTLINLVLRFYDADEGQVLVDGTDIRDLPLACLRRQVGVVLQETFLFTGTLLDNIRFSRPDATREEVIAAARIANAHDFIVKMPDGYDTWIGEKGQTISGGERQRIAIARAVLCDPRILILDEATASLDVETEQLIQEALSRLVKGRTTFAIAHRLATLRHADRLVVLDKGRIAEEGTHAELLRNRGIYWRLVRAQRRMTRLRGEGEGKDRDRRDRRTGQGPQGWSESGSGGAEAGGEPEAGRDSGG